MTDMLMDGGSTSTEDETVIQLTLPSQEELQTQVSMSQNEWVALAKNGDPIAFRAVLVEDGFAVRKWGLQEGDWQWVRDADIDTNFTTFNIVDMKPYLDALVNLQAENNDLRSIISIYVSNMGKKSLNRLRRMLRRTRKTTSQSD